MPTPAKKLLDELRTDHRNMAVLLNILQAEADRMEHDEEIDYELAHDIMRYMTVYSDAVHHPREDLVYAGLLAGEPAVASGLERIAEQHGELATLGARLRNDFGTVLAGSAIARARVVADTRRYLDYLRRHMAWEEEDLFRRADARADTLEIDDSHLKASDPVFGSQRRASFTGLYEAIRRETD